MADYDTAKAEVERRAQTALDPVVSPDELDEILEKHLIATRANSTAYVYGQKVRPATRNGHVYMAVEGGTSAATVPTWPITQGSVLVDGTVSWQEVEVDRLNAYDIRSAIRETWELKAAKASEYLKSSDADESVIYERCMQQARRYAHVGVA